MAKSGAPIFRATKTDIIAPIAQTPIENPIFTAIDNAPNSEKMIIAIGKMKTVFTVIVRSLLCIIPNVIKIKKTIKTQTGVWLTICNKS